MSTTTATLNINATQATQTLTRVQRQVDSLGSAFSKLGNIIGGLAIGTMVTNLLRSADAMDDLANATGFTIAEINGLGAAFAANGGEAQDAETAITRFANSLDEARNGSAKTQSSLAKIGVTLNDLRTLNDQDIFRKVIRGLGEMPAGAQRTALAMELLGKNVRAVDFTGVNDGLDTFVQQSQRAEPGIKNAAALFDNLRAIGRETTNQLFADTSTLTGSLKELTANTKEVATTISQLINLLLIFGSALGALRLISVINQFTGMIKVMKEGGKTVALLSLGLNALKTAFQQLIYVFTFGKVQLKAFTGGALVLVDALANLGRFALRFGSVAAVIYGIGEALKYMGLQFNPIQKLFSFLADVGIVVLARLKGEVMSLWESWTYLVNGIVNTAAPVVSAIYSMFQTPIDFAISKLKDLRDWWGKVVDESKKALGMGTEGGGVGRPGGGRGRPNTDDVTPVIDANEKLRDSIYEVNKAYALQFQELSNSLDKQYEYINLSQHEVEILQAQDDIRKRAADSIAKLIDIKEGLKEEEKGLIPIINQQIESIIRQRDVQVDAVAKQIQSLQQYKIEQDKLLKSTELLKQQLESETSLNQLRDQIELIGLMGDELEDATLIMQVSQELEAKLVELRQQELDLIARKTELTDQQFQNELSHINALRTAASQYANDRLEAERAILEAQRATQENAAAGAKQAIKDIADQFKPYNMAQEAVKKGWDAIGNAVDTFVETGKFKFSDFARSVIQDLAKMIAKAMIFKAISTALGAFGIKIPGLAEGGPVKGGQPYIVGEKGPELFVPQGNGKIVPNNQLQGSSQGGVTASAGPITNNYNTYNINALDAKSVAQLFAENRKAIFGANKMAEREMSYAGVR